MKFGIILVTVLLAAGWISVPVMVSAQNAVEFPGVVLKVDEAAGKLAVKNINGTRFAFTVDGRTRYVGVNALKELVAGDTVTVTYIVMGSQYIAQTIAKK